MRKIKLRGVTGQAQVTQLKPEGLTVEPRSSDSIWCSFQDTVHSQQERRRETSEKASIEVEGAPMSFPCSLNPQPTVHWKSLIKLPSMSESPLAHGWFWEKLHRHMHTQAHIYICIKCIILPVFKTLYHTPHCSSPSNKCPQHSGSSIIYWLNE